MQSAYLEYQPSAHLAPHVECFWSYRVDEPEFGHRVLPDGCADILFAYSSDGKGGLSAVGTMSKVGLFDLPRGILLGARFRPGMLASYLRVSGRDMVDDRLPLETISSTKASSLVDSLLEAFEHPTPSSIKTGIELIETSLKGRLDPPRSEAVKSVQAALNWATKANGLIRVEELAGQTGLSARQFQRVCIELTGLTPKRLCRAIRFRHAAEQAVSATGADWAGLALDCGYYDQAHFINEFRTLSGLRPTEYVASLSL
jgi:AraC-like DNA-binding protein